MKNSILLFLILFPFCLFAQNVEVSDYQVPVSRATTLRFTGQWDWDQQGDSVRANSASSNVFYRTFYSSLPLAWFVNVDAAGAKQFSAYSHQVDIDASFFKYIWDSRNWFSFAQINAAHFTDYKQIASDLTSGFGYGRYIDATALAKAVRIEDHLINDGVIKDHLPKDIILQMAYIIEREEEYQDLYGDVYEIKWFEDLEAQLEKSGNLTEDHLAAIGTIRMRQVLFSINERVNNRYYGWDARLGVLFPMTTADKSTPGNPNLILAGQYAYPLSWRIQINTRAEIFSPIDSTFGELTNLRAGLDFIYELSNRVNLVLGSNLTAQTFPSEKSILSTNLFLSFLYYLENKIFFTVSSGIIKQSSSRTSIFQNIGIQYNLF